VDYIPYETKKIIEMKDLKQNKEELKENVDQIFVPNVNILK